MNVPIKRYLLEHQILHFDWFSRSQIASQIALMRAELMTPAEKDTPSAFLLRNTNYEPYDCTGTFLDELVAVIDNPHNKHNSCSM
jgi:hypothetical protein